jgi:hypothetical protein
MEGYDHSLLVGLNEDLVVLNCRDSGDPEVKVE